MLKPQKKKIKKKDLKHDPLLDSLMKVQTGYEEHKNKINYVIVGFLIAVLLGVWFVALYNETEQEAVTLLGKAQVEYDQFNYSKARNFLTNLIDEYSGTDAQEQGLFLLANLNFNENNINEAKALFEEFVSSYSGSEILLASAYAGIAACLETENNYTEAAENYIKAHDTAREFIQAAEYLYLAALNYLDAGNSADAIDALQQIVDDYPDSPRKFDAQTKLILAAK